ncbi:MAG: PQQ-dependent sugar dehydrogenase [Hyphomicrobiaceae bacterium]|nr:PQQ-dependent sugar dehydrogenase [Hyphomicrobiaceae bacterium]
MGLAALAALGAGMSANETIAQNLTKALATPATKLKIETVAKGLDFPWGLQFLPDGRMLVTERVGRLRIVTNDGKLSAPVAGVPAVVARQQGGLLDVALARDFATSGEIFLSYAEPREGGRNGTALMRAKLELDAGGSGKLTGGTVIFRQKPDSTGGYHFGSRIVVTADGSLFLGLGDRYGLRDEAQNPGNHIGKVIRIMPDGKPFPGNPKRDGWAPEVWSIGHRNIQGAALDANGVLWTTEHGAKGGDELNRTEAGKNYGWPVITYGVDYSGAKIGIGTAKDGLEQPVYYWNPSIATSGLAYYSGNLFKDWTGSFLAGGLAGSHIARLAMKDGVVVGEEKLLADQGWRIRDVRQGPDGAVYVLTDDGNGLIVRLTPG